MRPASLRRPLLAQTRARAVQAVPCFETGSEPVRAEWLWGQEPLVEYDDKKSRRNLMERGIDFDFAARIFEGRYVVFEDGRRDYGETRYSAIGPIDDVLYVVVYTERNDRRRIISARRANRRERDGYRSTVR